MMYTIKHNDCEKLYKEFCEFVEESRRQILMADMRPEEYRLLVPDIIQTLIHKGADIFYMNNNQQRATKIMGIDIEAGYEMKFVLFHPDYTLFKREYMFFSQEININL